MEFNYMSDTGPHEFLKDHMIVKRGYILGTLCPFPSVIIGSLKSPFSRRVSLIYWH